MKATIIEVKEKDFDWPFEGKPRISGLRGTTNFDPFPCYAHDKKLVTELVNEVVARFPVNQDVKFYIAHKEFEDRVNAYATKTYNYSKKNENGEYPWDGVIVFSGKRIPPHPAMTRHLVAHEYGHQVMYHMGAQRAGTERDSYEQEQALMSEYCKMRGMKKSNRYGGLQWHASPGEVFANDFRTIICGLESEYWPHPQLKHPLELPTVVQWWKEQQKLRLKEALLK